MCWALAADFAVYFPCRGKGGEQKELSVKQPVLQSHFVWPCFAFLGWHLLSAVNILQRDLIRQDKDKVLLSKFLGAVDTWKDRRRVPGLFVMQISSAVPGHAAHFDAGYFLKLHQGAMCSFNSWGHLLCNLYFFLLFIFSPLQISSNGSQGTG